MKKNTLFLSLLIAFCFGVNAQVLKVSEAHKNENWSENTTWYLIQVMFQQLLLIATLRVNCV